MAKRRVVVTGLGAVTPLGTGVEKSWQSLCQGKSGIGMITRFDTSDFKTKIAGEVNDLNPLDFINRKLVRRFDRFTHFALAAAHMAVEDSGLTINPSDADRVGVVIATAACGIESLIKNHELLLFGERHRISPFFIPSFPGNMPAGQVAIQCGAKGPNLCPVTACAAGTHAIGEAARIIQRGDAEVIITGGTDSAVSPLIFAGLDAGGFTSPKSNEPEKASRPFDKDRDGFVSSEGSGIIILEELEFALNREAKIYAEVLGYGRNCDAYHIVAPDPEGEGAAKCMQLALTDAAITADKIDYINAHGTSTVLNDLTETKAIKKVFQGLSHKIPISANKSMIGHLWGAAGTVEAIFSILTITHGIIPPTINYETPDPECDLDYVPNVARKAKVRAALSNSFGIGSTNGCIIFGHFPPQ
ncbi:MAG: beta-ketoacyl-[acyl-carrier-protein] synthase II [Dehalococcoidales bacterium]|mgnify:CR=1 FL=1|jgi:3-oxoacyl-[acyl-carrier-protein] synthase II|nr:beta-ketoacyl-[acyl-carrier-protein] synthase II [Dehalococcoidales bacterium]